MRKLVQTAGLYALLGIGACNEEQTQKEKNQIAIEEHLTPKEVMQKHFPLQEGNTWTYVRTVQEGAKVFNCTEATIEKSWDKPKGLTYLVVSLGNAINEMPSRSEETYSVTEKDKGIFWKVNVQGDNPRDGRYEPRTGKTEETPEVIWGYVGDGAWEIIKGEHMGDETRNQIWSVVIKPDIIISPSTEDNEAPNWAIGAKMCDGEITVPAGTFSNCLMNCRMVYGKNLEEVLFNGAIPEYVGDFGCFKTESFFAKNVGLVKEVQYDGEGKVTYTLELKTFKVK